MKVLFAGNSQMSCIKLAFDAFPEVMKDSCVSFYIVPGGQGPPFIIENKKLKIISRHVNIKFPPRVTPETAKDAQIDSYDAIIVGALGHYDGGFCFGNPVLHCGILQKYLPKHNEHSNTPISTVLYKEILYAYFSKQPGFIFLRALRESFTGVIIVHPFPVPSEVMKTHPEWALNKMYNDPLGAHAFFMQLRDDFLEKECRANEAILLPYPRPDYRKNLFAPADIMHSSDGLHPKPEYGLMVLRQIAETLAACDRTPVAVSTYETARREACTICGSTSFKSAWNGRLNNGVPPRCAQCLSCERHRVFRRAFDDMPPAWFSDKNLLQFFNDPSVPAERFGKTETSIFNGTNHLDLQAIDRPDAFYDWVVCNYVLELVADDQKAMRELLRIIRPGGVLLFSYPSPIYREKTNDWGYPDENRAHHYRTYGRDAIATRFADAFAGWYVLSYQNDDPVTNTPDICYFATRDPLKFAELRDRQNWEVIISQDSTPQAPASDHL